MDRTIQTPNNQQGPAAQGYQPAAQGYQPAAQGYQPAAQGYQPAAQGYQPAAAPPAVAPRHAFDDPSLQTIQIAKPIHQQNPQRFRTYPPQLGQGTGLVLGPGGPGYGAPQGYGAQTYQQGPAAQGYPPAAQQGPVGLQQVYGAPGGVQQGIGAYPQQLGPVGPRFGGPAAGAGAPGFGAPGFGALGFGGPAAGPGPGLGTGPQPGPGLGQAGDPGFQQQVQQQIAQQLQPGATLVGPAIPVGPPTYAPIDGRSVNLATPGMQQGMQMASQQTMPMQMAPPQTMPMQMSTVPQQRVQVQRVQQLRNERTPVPKPASLPPLPPIPNYDPDSPTILEHTHKDKKPELKKQEQDRKKIITDYDFYFMNILFYDPAKVKESIEKSDDYITKWFGLFITQPDGLTTTSMEKMIEKNYKELISGKITFDDNLYKNISTNLTILKEMVHNIRLYCINTDTARQFVRHLSHEHKKKLLGYFIYYKEILRIHENFVFHKKFADDIYKNGPLNDYVKRFAIIQIMNKYMNTEPTKNQNFFTGLSGQQGKKEKLKTRDYDNFKYLSENLHLLTKYAINDKDILKFAINDKYILKGRRRNLKKLIQTLIDDVGEPNQELLKNYFEIDQFSGGKKVATKKSKK